MAKHLHNIKFIDPAIPLLNRICCLSTKNICLLTDALSVVFI